MRFRFNNVREVRQSGLLSEDDCPIQTGRLTQSTHLEDMIYCDLLAQAKKKPAADAEAFARDVFQSFYGTFSRRTDAERLKTVARECDCRLLELLYAMDAYRALRETCEGRDLCSFEAAMTFCEQITAGRSTLLQALDGGKHKLAALEHLEQQKHTLLRTLKERCERYRVAKTPELAQEICHLAAQVASKCEQVDAVRTLIHRNFLSERAAVAALVREAAQKALETAELVRLTEICWSDGAGNGRTAQKNRALLERVRRDDRLLAVMRQLGRMKEVVAELRRNAYLYGRGEKYSLTLGKDLKNVLSGELAMLAAPATTPLFLRRYAGGALKQYARREKIRKGKGDVIICLDETSSTRGEKAAWGKAFALAMQDICAHDKRKCAMIHFASASQIRTDLFLPGQYAAEDVLAAAEHFFGGGTDFEAPLHTAMELIAAHEFADADIVFITDGLCDISSAFEKRFPAFLAAHHATVQGVLLDVEASDDFSLSRFCESVLSTKTFTGQEIERIIWEKQIA